MLIDCGVWFKYVGRVLCAIVPRNFPSGHRYLTLALVEFRDSALSNPNLAQRLLRPITELTLAARLRVADRVMHLQSEVLRERHNLARSAAEWAGSNRRLTVVAMTDLLTRLPNRRHGLDFLAAEWALALGNNLPMACLMIDIDHFKSINDRYRPFQIH